MTVEIVATDEAAGEGWTAKLGDSCERLVEIPDETVSLTCSSPPFASLFTYSPSERDLGNSPDRATFLEHYGFIIAETLRVTRPGGIACIHVQQLTTTKSTHGHMGLTDFRGDVIRAHVDGGWIFHGEVTVNKDPQAQAIRTHAHALMFTNLDKDSSVSRPALADYLLVFKKPGDRTERISQSDGHPTRVSHDEWIDWAQPIWWDIRETNTLNTAVAKEDADERHICLAEGTLVLTRDGYVPIEEVHIGDEVLTHLGRWRPVLAKMLTDSAATVVRTTGQGIADLRTTPDHQLRMRVGVGPHAKRKAQASDPTWVEAREAAGSYLQLPLPPVEPSTLSEIEAWIIGRYLGDGHRAPNRRSGKRGGVGQFLISCGRSDRVDLLEHLGPYAGHEHDTGTSIQVALAGLRPTVRTILDRCGRGAGGKRVPAELLSLDSSTADAVLQGYLSADGHYVSKHDRWQASSISRSLLLGMAMIAQRARGVVASVYAGRPDRDHVIDGRSVHARQDWIMASRDSPGYRPAGWIDSEGAWRKVRNVIELHDPVPVWDIQVADDASFVAEGAVVSNCPLQLDFIERCIRLWSNPGDLVLDPFGGIGSTGVVAIQQGRRSISCELKPSYYATAVRNLQAAEAEAASPSLFDGAAS